MFKDNVHRRATSETIGDSLRNWLMVVVFLIFVSLYAAAIIDWHVPFADDKIMTRLGSVIFLLIGYYFGSLLGQQNEKTLIEQVKLQTQYADAYQSAKELAMQSREMLKERIKNARSALTSEHLARAPASGSDLVRASQTRTEGLHYVIAAAQEILDC